MGNTHALLMTDLEDGRDNTSSDISSRFGPPADFVADNTWRHSTIPLLSLYANANPGMAPLKLSAFSFHDHGWRGGRRGLHYWIYRVQPVPAGRTMDISVMWAPADLTGIVDVETSVDDSPEGDPTGKHEFNERDTVAAAIAKSGATLKDGWNYVHVRAKNGAGIWSATAHRKFFLDTTAPRVVKTEPADGGTLASQTIRIFLQEEHGIDLSGMTVRVDGEVVTPLVAFDAVTGVMTYDALAAGKRILPGAKIVVEVSGLADKFGNVQTKPYSFSFVGGAQAAQAGPAIETFSYLGSTQQRSTYRQYDMELSYGLSFEEHFGHVHAMRDCKMEWLNDPALASEGDRAVRFTGLQDDGDPQVMLHKNAWYIDRLPLIHFDYKADPGFKVDLQVEVFGVWYSVRFTGTGHAPNEGGALGRFRELLRTARGGTRAWICGRCWIPRKYGCRTGS